MKNGSVIGFILNEIAVGKRHFPGRYVQPQFIFHHCAFLAEAHSWQSECCIIEKWEANAIPMRKVTAFRILNGFCLELTIDDGVHGIVDLSDLAGKGVFNLWLDRIAFENVHIGSSGELAWGDKIDLCPDSLYLKATGKEPQDVFPSLKGEPLHA